VETRVELLFDVLNSVVLSQTQKSLVQRNLKNHINNNGVLLLANETERTQLRNKNVVTKRFYKMMQQALIPEKKRKLTEIPKVVQAKRLVNKKQQSEKKALRKKVNLNDIRQD
jgi:ribosome-associated protein